MGFNRADKKFFRPATIKKWVIVVYEGERRFNMETARGMATSFAAGARAVGKCRTFLSLLRSSLINFIQASLFKIHSPSSFGRMDKELSEM